MMANNNNTATTNNNSNSNNNNNPFVGEGIGNGGNDDDDEHAHAHQLTSSTTTNDMEPSFSNNNTNDLLFEPSRSVCSILVKTMMIYKKAYFTYVFLGICGAIPAIISNWIWFTKDFESKLESWINDGFNITIIPHGNGNNSTDTHTHNGEDIIDGNFEMIWDYLSTIKPLHFLWIILIGIAMYILSLIIRVATIRTTIQVYCNKNHAYKNSLINLSKAILTIPRMIKLAFMYWSFIWGAILIVGIASLIISGLMWLIIGNNIIKTLVLTLYHVIVHCIFIWFMYCCMFWNIVYVVEEKHREDSTSYQVSSSLGYSNLIRPFMRSYYLVKQQWWFVFFGTLFFNLIFVFVLVINSVVFYHLPGGMIVVFIMQTLTMVIFTPLSTIYYVVLYVNARIYNSQQRQLGGGGDDYEGEEFNINILADDMKLVDSSMMTNLNDIMHDEEGGLTTLTFTSSTAGATTNNDNALDEPLLRNVE